MVQIEEEKAKRFGGYYWPVEAEERMTPVNPRGSGGQSLSSVTSHVPIINGVRAFTDITPSGQIKPAGSVPTPYDK